MSKIRAVKIELSRAEGPSHLCGKPRTVEVPDVWNKAHKILLEWSETAPKAGEGYDKTDFTVTYEDGETYTATLDIRHHTAPNNDLDVGRHMRDFLMFESGRDDLSRYPLSRHQGLREYLARSPAEFKAGCGAFLDRYEIEDGTLVGEEVTV